MHNLVTLLFFTNDAVYSTNVGELTPLGDKTLHFRYKITYVFRMRFQQFSEDECITLLSTNTCYKVEVVASYPRVPSRHFKSLDLPFCRARARTHTYTHTGNWKCRDTVFL